MTIKAEENAISIPDTYYIGFRSKTAFDTDKFPLVFVTPFGTDKSSEKRLNTVKDWCRTRAPVTNEADGVITRNWVSIDGTIDKFENVWIEGFKFSGIRSRYSTDNKVYQIEDPRGFSLEVYSENLVELILNGSIENGLIKGEHCWARHKGKPFLLKRGSALHKDYLLYNSNLIEAKKTTIKIGDMIGELDSSHSECYIANVYAVKIHVTLYPDYYHKKYILELDYSFKPWKMSVSNYTNTDLGYYSLCRNWSKKEVVRSHDDEFQQKCMSRLNFGVPFQTNTLGEIKYTDNYLYNFNIFFRTEKDIKEWLDKNSPNNFKLLKDFLTEKCKVNFR